MNWVWFWRALGVLAGVTMLAVLGMFWTAWRASHFVPAANGEELKSGIDVISIQLDILSLVVAVAGIGLAVMGFLGYQSIKSWAEAAAIKAATAKADEVATAAIALHMQNMPGTDGGTQQPVEPGQLTEITAEEEGE
jgi:hypothetical protein